MSAIDNIRRDLSEASYLKYSPVPFAGAVHDFSKPLRARFESRAHVGPYYFSPAKPGTGRGFYQSSEGLACGDSAFRLRLAMANDYIATRLSNTNGYHCDRDGDGDILEPIIARLPGNRGFLAGWTMGEGMAAALDCEIYKTPQAAAFAAHDMAERDAEKNHEAQEQQADSRFETVTGTAPSYWAVYFINGDSSGMEDSEIEQADAFAEWLGGNIVSCEDAGFIHYHDAHQFGVGASDCQTYTALIEK